jgi:hypothetical protein
MPKPRRSAIRRGKERGGIAIVGLLDLRMMLSALPMLKSPIGGKHHDFRSIFAYDLSRKFVLRFARKRPAARLFADVGGCPEVGDFLGQSH